MTPRDVVNGPTSNPTRLVRQGSGTAVGEVEVDAAAEFLIWVTDGRGAEEALAARLPVALADYLRDIVEPQLRHLSDEQYGAGHAAIPYTGDWAARNLARP